MYKKTLKNSKKCCESKFLQLLNTDIIITNKTKSAGVYYWNFSACFFIFANIMLDFEFRQCKSNLHCVIAWTFKKVLKRDRNFLVGVSHAVTFTRKENASHKYKSALRGKRNKPWKGLQCGAKHIILLLNFASRRKGGRALEKYRTILCLNKSIWKNFPFRTFHIMQTNTLPRSGFFLS